MATHPLTRLFAALPWGQEAVASWAGVSYHTARSWAQRKRNPSPEALRRLAAALRERAQWLGKVADDLDREANRGEAQ